MHLQGMVMDLKLIRQAATAVRTLSMDLAEELFGQTQMANSNPLVRRQLAEDLALLAAAEHAILRYRIFGADEPE